MFTLIFMLITFFLLVHIYFDVKNVFFSLITCKQKKHLLLHLNVSITFCLYLHVDLSEETTSWEHQNLLVIFNSYFVFFSKFRHFILFLWYLGFVQFLG